MKTIKYFVMAFAAVAMLASCAKDGGEKVNNDGPKKSIAIKIVNMAVPETRAIGDITPGGEVLTSVVEATDLTAYFYAGTTWADTRTLAGTYDEDNDEYVFNGLPGNVTNVVFTNMTQAQATAWLTDGTLPEPGETVTVEEVTSNKWNPADGNVKKTPVIGKNLAPFTYVDQVEENGVIMRHYQTSLTVNALFARLEISGIECTDLGGRFKALGLDEIGLLYGDVTRAAWDAAPAWQYDAFTAESLIADEVLPAEGKAFVYNVDPADGVPSIVLEVIGTGTDSQYPNLVDNIFADGVTYRVRTSALYEGTDITDDTKKIIALAPGAIYQIKYSFLDEHVGPWTGAEPSTLICVDVTVTINNWVVKPVITPDFN